MILAITQRLTKSQKGSWIDSLELNYCQLFTNFGCAVIPIPNSPGALTCFLKKFTPDFVVLSGGGDIDIRYDRQNPEPKNFREQTEYGLVEYAIERNIPILGICRGFQFLNLYFKGSLCADIHTTIKNHKPGNRHELSITDSTLKKLLGDCATSNCNTYHDQGVFNSDLSGELTVFANCGDLVEGFYHKTLPIAAIQWHPERENNLSTLDHLLISSFLERKLYWGAK